MPAVRGDLSPTTDSNASGPDASSGSDGSAQQSGNPGGAGSADGEPADQFATDVGPESHRVEHDDEPVGAVEWWSAPDPDASAVAGRSSSDIERFRDFVRKQLGLLDERFLGRLGQRYGQLIRQLEQLVRQLEQLIRQLLVASRRLQ